MMTAMERTKSANSYVMDSRCMEFSKFWYWNLNSISGRFFILSLLLSFARSFARCWCIDVCPSMAQTNVMTMTKSWFSLFAPKSALLDHLSIYLFHTTRKHIEIAPSNIAKYHFLCCCHNKTRLGENGHISKFRVEVTKKVNEMKNV